MTNSNFAGETVPKQDTQPFRETENINQLEHELENADAEFRKAAETSDVAAMVSAHHRVCQAVAKMSAMFAGNGKPVVFARYLNEPSSPAPLPAADQPAAPSHEPAASSAARDSQPAFTFVTTAELERQIASLAQQMQKCLEAGDMDGMLKCNEKMGELSEMIGRQEAAMKEAAANDPLAKINEAAGIKEEVPAGKGAWSAGDTLALARQRAEERKRQIKKEQDDILSQLNNYKNAEDLREWLEMCNFYEILSMPSSSSFEELHKSFLRKIRRLNQLLADKQIEDWQFQEYVTALALAHDVLKYPSARMQYDLGLFGPGEMTIEATVKQKVMPLKEMLRFSTLISMLDLIDAGDAAEGKNEREIGYWLVEQGKLSQEELDSILFAQKLVSAKKLTLAQFELAMQEMRENNIPLLDTLIASEWIQPSDVLNAEG